MAHYQQPEASGSGAFDNNMYNGPSSGGLTSFHYRRDYNTGATSQNREHPGYREDDERQHAAPINLINQNGYAENRYLQ